MTAAAPAAPLGLLAHVVQTLRLAVPVMLARAGLVILITVDTVMCGAAGGDALAFYGASLAPHITMLTVGIGLLTGTVVYVAQMAGAGRPAECGRIWKRALAIAALLGTAYMVALLFGLITVLSVRVVWDDYRFEETSPGIGVPQWWYSVWMPVLCALTTARAVQVFVRLRRGRATTGAGA